MSDFRSYTLKEINQSPRGVYDLADGLLPEMALAIGYEGLGDRPSAVALQDFIKQIGPNEFLQDNIPLVQERLGTKVDPKIIAADWADRSGSLLATHRSFSSGYNGQNSIPRSVGAAVVFNTVVGRWQERRVNEVEALKNSGIKLSEAVIFAGNRVMRETEHPQVAKIAAEDGTLPTEARFAEKYSSQLLRHKTGLVTSVVSIDSASGDEVFAQGLEQKAYLLGSVVIAIGNAPSTVQVAGQFRKVATHINPDYDSTGSQLYMAGDAIEVARNGEGPATHQDPLTALGQIARNAFYLHDQATYLRSRPSN